MTLKRVSGTLVLRNPCVEGVRWSQEEKSGKPKLAPRLQVHFQFTYDTDKPQQRANIIEALEKGPSYCVDTWEEEVTT